MSLVRRNLTRRWVPAGDVLLSEPIALRDVARLRTLCFEAALKVGLGVEQALSFIVAVDQGMRGAIELGEGSFTLTVVHHGTDVLAAQVARRGSALPPSLVDGLTLRSGRRATTLRLVVAVDLRERRSSGPRWSPPNRGHFT